MGSRGRVPSVGFLSASEFYANDLGGGNNFIFYAKCSASIGIIVE